MEVKVQIKIFILPLLIVAFSSSMGFSQEVNFQKFVVAYNLPPSVGSPLTVSQGLKKFQYRVYGNNTLSIPPENIPNRIGEDEFFFFIKGWKQVRKDPEFYIDFYFDSPVIHEEKVVEIKRPYIATQPLAEKVYEIKYTIASKCKIVKLDGSILLEIDFPLEEMNYQFDEKKASQLGYHKAATGEGFQNEADVLDAAKRLNNKMLKDLELAAVKYFMMGRKIMNNVHSTFFFKMFPYNYKETFELGLFNNVEGTQLEDLKLIEANEAALVFYNAIRNNYDHGSDHVEKLIEAIKIWTFALEEVNGLNNYPMRREVMDALGYNMAVGIAHLNNFELAASAIKILQFKESYGKGTKEEVRLEKMSARANFFLNDFFPHRKNMALYREWKKIDL